ncbi:MULTISPECIES: hypothetical protein [Cyanophyceae]|nr:MULTISPECIES: hypothetical protein [Cyanophyceae]MBD1918867.1 hypothetical protein [Phormidium sp. FACHB-77]MBD2033291.1 hypothetical protein [Phormidium sp. FACHB-322]MBD2053776.1 hypothetical protein [Leptolyngbya sp. FACHB-60]
MLSPENLERFMSSLGRFFGPDDGAALRLADRTPLLPEQARSLIREHGQEFAERVGELVSLAWSVERAVEVVSGRDEQGYRLVSQYMDLPRPLEGHELTDEYANHVAATYASQCEEIRVRGELVSRGFDFDRAVEALSSSGRSTLPKPIGYYNRLPQYPSCPYPPRHGTPSSFVEVCGDENVGRVQTACDRCAFYSPPPSCMSNSASDPALTCALHPLGRPEGRCGDWEDRRTEAAAMARGRAELRAREAYGEAIVRRRQPEAEAEIELMRRRTERAVQAITQAHQRSLLPGDAVTHETTEETWQWVQHSDGGQHRVLLSRTTTRHYADGRREIVTQESERSPRIEARTFINGIEQVVWFEGGPGDRVLPERPWLYP